MHRRAFSILVLVVLLTSCSSAPESVGTVPAATDSAATPTTPEGHAAVAPAPRTDPISQARSAGIARLGQPADPLPAPLSIATDTPDALKSLVRQIRAGGDDALSALLTSLRASGIAVVGAKDELVLRPAEPWQGQIVESWEVRLLLASVLPERTVTMSLPEFADQLRASPAFNSPAIEQLLVDDIRSLAHGTPSPKQFWARFVIELGRDAASTDETDLATARDLTKIRLSGLQASLILRRLSLDLLMLSGTGTRTGGIPHVAMALAAVPRADGELPCTMTSTQKTILDIASYATKAAVNGFKVFDLGFSGLLGYLDKIGLQSSGTSAVGQFKDGKTIASGLLTYAKLIAIYASLEVKVEMESAPLTRTKERRPASGEAKELTAVVRLNTGNAQILNCFRIMLNALGLDFKLTQDGPVKKARIGWQGDAGFSEVVEARGGPDQIVRFVGDAGSQIQSGGAVTSTNSITNASTDADGRTSVKVEGVGQRIKKSDNAARVIKRASVHVNVALKGADLFGDLADATGNAIGGAKSLVSLPADMLYRSQWASEGHYSFEVIDWSGTQWTGTVSIKKTDVTRRDVGGRSTDATTVRDATVQIIQATRYENIGDDSVAEMKGTIDGRYDRSSTVKWSWTQRSESRICVGQTFSGTDLEKDSEEGSGSGDARITVRASGLDYEILAVPANDLAMPVKGQILLQGHKFRQAGNGCQNVVVDTTTETMPVDRTEPILSVEIKGRADPDDLDRLSGSTTQTQDLGGTIVTTTITWDLRRD